MTIRKILLFRNLAFEKALALLAHPGSLAAMAVLLLNDHLLRRFVPSWWTGKLGDAAWLFFTPFVLAALLAWLVPFHWDASRREKWVFGTAFALVSVGFSAAKVLPPANIVAMRIFTAAFQAAPSLVLDPSDLLALPTLALSAWLWNRTNKAAGGAKPRVLVASPALRRASLPLAALLLLADAAAPNLGITCLASQNGKIIASGGYNASYVSQDGGLHWSTNQPVESSSCVQKTAPADQWQQVPGPRPDTFYRYQPGQEIQLSRDSGKTWLPGLKLAPLSEAERMYYMQTREGNPLIEPGPLDAAPDPVTGNMLFAMGQQGVLVHTAQGQWIWSMGGQYARPEGFPNPEAFSVLLGGMVYLAAGLVLLIYTALALRWTRKWLGILVFALGAAGWLVVTILFPPATSYGYTAVISLVGVLAVIILLLPLAVEQTFRLVRRAPKALPRLILLSLASGLLFLLPYGLWLYSTLPGIGWATIFALLISAAVLLGGIAANRRMPVRSPEAHFDGTIAADAKDHSPLP